MKWTHNYKVITCRSMTSFFYTHTRCCGHNMISMGYIDNSQDSVTVGPRNRPR